MGIEQVFGLAGVVLLFATLIVAAFTDLTQKKVYNWITLPAIALGLALAYGAGGLGAVRVDGAASTGLLAHLAGFGVAFVVFFVVYWSGGLGGGDVKLMAAIGALTGYPFILGAMFWSSLVGAVMAVWVLLWRKQLLFGLQRSVRHVIALPGAAAVRPDPPRGASAPAAARAPGPERTEASAADAATDGGEDPARLRIPYGVAISFGTLIAWFLLELPRL